VAAAVTDIGIATVVAAPEHDLGPHLIAAIKECQALEASAQGELVRQRVAAWSEELALAVEYLLQDHTPDLLVTALFGRGRCASPIRTHRHALVRHQLDVLSWPQSTSTARARFQRSSAPVLTL